MLYNNKYCFKWQYISGFVYLQQNFMKIEKCSVFGAFQNFGKLYIVSGLTLFVHLLVCQLFILQMTF